MHKTHWRQHFKTGSKQLKQQVEKTQKQFWLFWGKKKNIVLQCLDIIVMEILSYGIWINEIYS